ncbi:hypothetical protein IMSAG049_00955 [Clostridiales bacterium]|nr:hypothetical protein IMSAG049_00955 [Clostridiales bacterium]
MRAKYITVSVLSLAIFAASFSLPVIYGRQVDSKTLDKVKEVDADDYIDNLATIDTAGRIHSILEAAFWAEKNGITAIPVYNNATSSDVPEKTKLKIREQLSLLEKKGLLPDLTALNLSDEDMVIDLFNLYTPEITHSFMRVNFDSVEFDDYENITGYHLFMLLDPDNYCVYYCSFRDYENVLDPNRSDTQIQFPAFDENYLRGVAEYYSATAIEKSSMIVGAEAIAYLQYDNFDFAYFSAKHDNYSFDFGIRNIYYLLAFSGVISIYDSDDLVNYDAYMRLINNRENFSGTSASANYSLSYSD